MRDYNYFGRHLEKVIAFFDKHMKASHRDGSIAA
jgi:hypothetical protein